MDPIHVAESEIFHDMVERNLQGQVFERSGNIDKAIELFEQNVSDRFSGNYPYERLRIIYTKRKQYQQAIRVCRAFMSVAEAQLNAGSQRADLKRKATKFADWIAKLEISLSNSTP